MNNKMKIKEEKERQRENGRKIHLLIIKTWGGGGGKKKRWTLFPFESY
jgi:hypothetical protein